MQISLREVKFGAFQRCQSGRQAKVSPALTFFAGFWVKPKIGTREWESVLDLQWLNFLTTKKAKRQVKNGRGDWGRLHGCDVQVSHLEEL
ncbi:hypothetical protein [Longibacter salinarum]|uniref:hypothetical protein n=1 Tax=Longibacter salinarum TaxID=1850348 RepID=UPI001180653C|nr:hypothetical protein [Longibacter salinarum]